MSPITATTVIAACTPTVATMTATIGRGRNRASRDPIAATASTTRSCAVPGCSHLRTSPSAAGPVAPWPWSSRTVGSNADGRAQPKPNSGGKRRTTAAAQAPYTGR